MKTILFNTDKNQPVNGVVRNGFYTIDGIRPILPSNIVELEFVEAAKEQLEQHGYWGRKGNRYEYIISNDTIEDPKDEGESTGFWGGLLNIFK